MSKKPGQTSLMYNLISLFGVLLSAFGFIAGALLIAIDTMTPFDNPYIGIFTYMVVPALLAGGLLLMVVGVLRERALRRHGETSAGHMPVIDLNNKRHLRNLASVVVVTLLFIAISVVGGYRAYHFSDSVEFCGKTCHSVMKPEYTAYQHSPHANAGCVTCHIGPGADFFVKAKLNGLYQVYSTIFNKYHRPIPAPVHNLRPAKETCYTCHWPSKFFGSIEMKRTYFRNDETNTPWTIQMLLKVGGGDPENGRAQGIHWHMAIANKIEYIATDEKRQQIPWIRMTDQAGNATVYQTTDTSKRLSPEQVATATIRTMDCIDCHNRPTHQYHSPERALDNALANGLIDASLPSIKANGAKALTGDYKTEGEALKAIQEKLRAAYPADGANVEKAIASIQRIYSQNFFPEMKVNWKEYPDHIGHMVTPGCFRCHDGKHASDHDPGKTISHDCSSCHTIIAQGSGMKLETTSTGGLPFQHPEDIGDEWKESNCSDCHTGIPVY